MELQIDEACMRVLELLHFALEAHGIASTIDGRVVRLAGGSDLAFEPRVFDGPPNERAKIIQLDIVARSPRIEPRCIVESMAGIGSDQADAERHAFGKFLQGPFHVLLTALADHTCESKQSEWLLWHGSGGDWRICEGALLVHGSGDTSTTYPQFFKELEKLFLSSASRDVHWVRIFVGSFDGKQAGADALLDNEPWPEAMALLNRWEWDFPQEYRSLRHFFVAVPDPERQ
jgi:hypothetical protein